MTGTFSQHAQLLTSQHFNVQRKAPLRASRDVIMSRRIKFVTHRARKPQVSGVEAGCSSEEQLPSCSRPLGFTLRLHMDRSPSPSSPSYQPAAWLGSHHRERLIESYAVFFPECAVHVFFLYSGHYKRLTFPFLSTSRFLCLFLKPLSAVSEEGKGNVDSIKVQGSHLLLLFAAL